MSLSGVIRGPVLRVGLARDLYCLSDHRADRPELLALEHVLDSENVLAACLCEFVVWTGAARRLRIGIYLVFTLASLRRY